MSDRLRFDYRKLRGKIVEVYGNGKSFAEATGISRSWLSTKLNEGSSMRQEEILIFAKALGIPDTEFVDYFFTTMV